MKGTYVLLLRLGKDQKIRIGSIGSISFRKGSYAYVGSGQASLEKRIGRHFRREKKRHWHIDYLLEKAEAVKAIYFESGKEECNLAKGMSENLKGVPKFGCSDCRCDSHLFYSEKDLEKEVVRSLRGRRHPLRVLRAQAA
jgi:Uri superfamily endonuclease